MAFLVRHVLMQSPVTEASVSQSLLLGIALVLLFPISVYTAGRVAKRIDVFEASYSEALWATVFKNVSAFVGVAVLSNSLSLPLHLTFPLVAAVFPIVIYRQVFLSTIRQAATIWLVVLAVEIVAGTCLVLAAVLFGHWLDERYDLDSLFATVEYGHAALVYGIAIIKPHRDCRR